MVYRKDPVEGTGKRRWRGKCFRKIKTTQERKWNGAYKEYVRCKRLNDNLTEYHDEIRHWLGRNWKRFGNRKHQWLKNN